MTNAVLIKNFQKSFITEDRESIEVGMEVEVHQEISEWGKTRIQKFRWLVIRTNGKSLLEKTFTVRRTSSNSVAIEKIFCLYSPTVKNIDVIRRFKIRQSNIAYIRDLSGKKARLREIKKVA